MTDPLKLVYRLTNAQRMALCGFLVEYTRAMLEPDSNLAQVFVNCSEVPSVELTPTDLLNIFMGSDEMEIERERRLEPKVDRNWRKPS